MIKNHLPVLLNQVLEAFVQQAHKPELILDGTFGRGGHTRALMEQFNGLKIVAFDKDLQAIEEAKKINSVQAIHDDFKNLKNYSVGPFDGALFDLGVSSPQFDEAQRGFSFQNDGPLDMRMNQSQQLNAAEIINHAPEKDLINIFTQWGEVKKPQRVVQAIVNDRVKKQFNTTRDLAGLIERVDRFKGKIHPATQYFMALRIAVNAELTGLGEFIESLPEFMKPGSRLCVISFHSLEDRIIKNSFRKMHMKFGKIINKKVIVATREEQLKNPRSRSAKLRVFEMGGSL